MTDIMERLRAAPSEIGTMTQAVEHMREAADEIERLRAALDILQAAMTAKKPIPLAFKKAIIEARATLEGKQ
jgi:hypothetical protein